MRKSDNVDVKKTFSQVFIYHNNDQSYLELLTVKVEKTSENRKIGDDEVDEVWQNDEV